MRHFGYILTCLLLAVACDRKEAGFPDAREGDAVAVRETDSGPAGPMPVVAPPAAPERFPVDDAGLAELAAAVPFDVLSPPLCGSNGPDYARRSAEEGVRYAALLEAFLQQPGAGERALLGVSVCTAYGRSKLLIASLDVVAALRPAGGEAVLDESARAIVLAAPVGEAPHFGGPPYWPAPQDRYHLL